MPVFRFAAAVANDAEQARQRCRTVLGLDGAAPPPPLPPAPAQRGLHDGALDAVRDVVGWNTVWDPVNRRPYTSLSRNWVAQKFGGWGVWLNDVLYHALLAGVIDPALARENLAAVMAGATAQGNFPCLLTGRDSWVDRSQPPIGAFIVWLLYLRTGARELLELSYPALLANHDWWWRTRDGNGDGLVEYGTSPLGGGLYRGTKLAAKDESSMDNSPTHDEASLDTKSWTLDCADVGLNSLLALDGEMLARIAHALGDTTTAARIEERAAGLRGRISERLWDPERRVFANRLWSGRFVRSLSPTSFYPLLAGAATAEQAQAMVQLLDDREAFGGDWLLPSVTRDDPAFADNVYWRGRIWPPLNFLTYHALRRAGFGDAAARLAENGYFLFLAEWQHRRCPENYNALTGAAADQPDTDLFYGWGALLPLLAVAEVTDVTPWDGWALANSGRAVELGPLVVPAGAGTVAVAGRVLTLAVDGRIVLRTDRIGRIRHLRLEAGSASMDVPAAGEPAWLELPQVPPSHVALARLADRPLQPEAAEGGSRFALPPAAELARLEIFLSGGEWPG
jgi:putative isomerase